MDEGAPGGSTLLEHNERVPVPGELKIHEKRSWKTWQLCAMALAMFLVGLYVESLSHVKPVAAISNSYKLPPPASSGSSVTTAPSGVTTTAPAGSVSTTLPTSGASATTLPQVAIVLVPRYPAGTGGTTGSWTSPSFTVASSPWNIGWAYACTGSNPSFTVTVNPGNTAAVTGTSLTGQNVTPESTTGTFTITATGSAGCQWAVKVTGIGTPAS